MNFPGESLTRLGRPLVVSLALVANLIAAGVPVLHAWSHEAGHHHGNAQYAPAEADHSHDEAHPLALHDECLLAKRSALDLALALPPLPPEALKPGPVAASAFHPVPPVSSRAPPGPGQPRAPPFV